MMANASPASQQGQQDQTGDAKIPGKEVLSHYLPFVGSVKAAALRDFIAQHLGALGKALPHAAVGAGIGAGLGAAESFTSTEPARQRVQELEGKENRGFGDTLDLAQNKARLTVGEFAGAHPALMMGMGALGGGITGLTQGPGLVDSVRRSVGHLKGIGQNVKDVYSRRAG